jgi:hypothetical protein
MTRPAEREKGFFQPWVVVAPEGVHWMGRAYNEADAWRIGLGYPDAEEIAWQKARGWYAAPATLSWKHPEDER